MRAHIDADILIWHLRGNQKAKQFLQTLKNSSEYELWIGLMQRAEIVFFMRPSEVPGTTKLLAQFSTESINQAVIDHAAELYRAWNPSHGVDINDMILAATVLRTGGKIYCLNVKHYPIPDLIVERAW